MTSVTRILLSIFILGCVSFNSLADSLSKLPQEWQQQLHAIAEVDISGADTHAQTEMKKMRESVGQHLDTPSTTDAELAEAYGRLASTYHINNIESAAQAGYKNAMKLEPKSFRWIYYAAHLENQSGRPEIAVLLFQQAKDLKPDYLPLQLQLGDSLLKLGKLEQAASVLNTVADNESLQPMALYQLAQIDLMKRRYREAATKLQQVLKLDPSANAIHYPLARALRGAKQNEEARKHISRIGKQLPRFNDPLIRELENLKQGARRYFGQGLKAGNRHDFVAATKAFAKGLAMDPGNINARISYARSLYLSGATDKAKTELKKVLTQNPKQTLALFLSAIQLEQDGNTDAALSFYQKVLKHDPQHYGAHFCLANRHYLDGGFAEAVRHYQSALAANPDIPPARIHNVMALKKSGASDKNILSTLEKFTAQYPDQMQLRYILIRLLTMSDDSKVRDLPRAEQLINQLVMELYIPPHLELQARVAATAGKFKRATELQSEIIPALFWQGEKAQDRAREILQAYQKKKLPPADWFEENSIIQLPINRAKPMFQEYPAAAPY